MALRPLRECLVKCSVMISTVVEKRNDALGLPRPSLSSVVSMRATSQHECLSDSFAERSICGKRIHHVADNGILDAIPNKQNCESAEQLAQEAACPAFGEVRSSEIGAGQNQRPAIGICVTGSSHAGEQHCSRRQLWAPGVSGLCQSRYLWIQRSQSLGRSLL